MDFFLFAELLHGFVVDLVHRVVGQRFLADRLQQALHEKLLAGELELALEVGSIAQFLVFRSFDTRIMSAMNCTR